MSSGFSPNEQVGVEVTDADLVVKSWTERVFSANSENVKACSINSVQMPYNDAHLRINI